MKKFLFAITVMLLIAFVIISCQKNETSSESGGNIAAAQAGSKPAIVSGIWYTDWDEGVNAARIAKKPVVVDFYADWCTYCKLMDKETFGDPEISKKLAEDWIGLKIDVEAKNKTGRVYFNSETKDAYLYKPDGLEGYEELTHSYSNLMSFFGGRGLPTIGFADSTGKYQFTSTGYMDKERFGPVLDYIKLRLWEKEITLQEYVESLKR